MSEASRGNDYRKSLLATDEQHVRRADRESEDTAECPYDMCRASSEQCGIVHENEGSYLHSPLLWVEATCNGEESVRSVDL